MPQLTRVNPVIDGNAIAVFGYYPLDIWEIDTHANLVASTGPQGALAAVIQVVEQNATIEILGKAGTLNLIGNGGAASTANGAVRVVTTGHEAWANAAVLQTALQALGTVDSQNLSNTIVYSVTF